MTKDLIDQTWFRPASDDHMRSVAEAWMEQLRPCLYTHWPERFKGLSFETHVETMTREETAELAGEFRSDPGPWSLLLLDKVSCGARKFASGCFFRLESRSPKDNYWGEATNFRACSSHDVKKLIYSERLLDDLVRYTHLGSEPLRLLFRKWHPIQKAGEFRCFIRDRKLAGISQYHYAGWDDCLHKTKPRAFAQVAGRASKTEATLKAFVDAEIIPHMHIDSLVVDLWLDHTGKITLIEINPYGLSDPCLFKYEELAAADGEFRYNPLKQEAV